MPSDVRPYLVPEADCLEAGPWLTAQGEEWVQLPDVVEGWVPGVDIPLRRDVRVDVTRIRQQAELPRAVQIAGCLSYELQNHVRRPLTRTVLSDDGVWVVSATLPGDRIAGRVLLRCTLTLVSSWEAPVGVAAQAGSVLVDMEQSLVVEGTAPLFPTTIIDFSRTTFDPDASFHLRMSSDLDAPFLGRFLLSLNSRDAELIAAVEAAEPTPREAALVDELRGDVARLLVHAALKADAEQGLADADWVEESVGAALKGVLSRTHLARAPELNGDVGDLDTMLSGAVRRNGQSRAFR